MRVILSARVIWAAVKNAEVTKKAWTTSMIAKKSRVEMVICCGGDAEVINLATSVEAVVFGVEGS